MKVEDVQLALNEFFKKTSIIADIKEAVEMAYMCGFKDGQEALTEKARQLYETGKNEKISKQA